MFPYQCIVAFKVVAAIGRALYGQLIARIPGRAIASERENTIAGHSSNPVLNENKIRLLTVRLSLVSK